MNRLRRSLLRIAQCSLVALAPLTASAHLCVQDDADRTLCLAAPAERIIALSPALAELLYDAGAGDRLVATVTFSNYPPAARQLPRVGTPARLDLEAIVAQRPDLIVAWSSGNPHSQLRQLQQLGLPVYHSEPHRLTDITTTLQRLSRLAGSEATGNTAAHRFQTGIDRLRRRYTDAAPVRVFYEVWEKPLMTINGRHLISQAIRLCGGTNIFGDLPTLAPRISREAVISQNPEAIVVGGPGEQDSRWLAQWRAYPALAAVQHDNLFFVPPSTLQRATPRILEGIRTLCQDLDQARARG